MAATEHILMDDRAVAQRILDHIDRKTTDLGEACWREPIANYRSPPRLARELAEVFQTLPVPFCPSAALPDPGDHVARDAAGTPLVAVRGADGQVNVFRNACRHRGAQVACGRGNQKLLVCPYHAWAYGLDGSLRHVPHEHGFPGLDRSTHGLVPVASLEHGGIVYVAQRGGDIGADVRAMPALLGPNLVLVSVDERVQDANWKIAAEAFIEGYHIRATHRETFYPVQYDNLNVVEHFGRNSRVAYPYRNIERLREVAPAERRTAGMLTFVYHLFPNVMVATFPKRTIMTVLEPRGLDGTRFVTYTLADAAVLAAERSRVQRDADFVAAGAQEDRAIVESIQRGLASEANTAFEYGRFEAAIVHFHRQLGLLLDGPA